VLFVADSVHKVME